MGMSLVTSPRDMSARAKRSCPCRNIWSSANGTRWPTPPPPSACWHAIGEPELVDTRNDTRLSRIFANKVIKIYPAFREFYGMEEVIEQVVSYFRHAAQGLEERKQILYLLGPGRRRQDRRSPRS